MRPAPPTPAHATDERTPAANGIAVVVGCIGNRFTGGSGNRCKERSLRPPGAG